MRLSQNNYETGGENSNREIKYGKIFATLFFVFALIGFVDATYLTIKNIRGESIECSLTYGCNTVTSSIYAEIFGIPVALFGAIYYLSVILLSVFFLDKKKEYTLYIISKLTWIGLIASAYFIFIQAFVLRAWCQYCIVSAITSTLLFIIGTIYINKNKKINLY